MKSKEILLNTFTLFTVLITLSCNNPTAALDKGSQTPSFTPIKATTTNTIFPTNTPIPTNTFTPTPIPYVEMTAEAARFVAECKVILDKYGYPTTFGDQTDTEVSQVFIEANNPEVTGKITEGLNLMKTGVMIDWPQCVDKATLFQRSEGKNWSFKNIIFDTAKDIQVLSGMIAFGHSITDYERTTYEKTLPGADYNSTEYKDWNVNLTVITNGFDIDIENLKGYRSFDNQFIDPLPLSLNLTRVEKVIIPPASQLFYVVPRSSAYSYSEIIEDLYNIKIDGVEKAFDFRFYAEFPLIIKPEYFPDY